MLKMKLHPRSDLKLYPRSDLISTEKSNIDCILVIVFYLINR